MSLSEKLAADLPYLRRYARALTGAQETGDALVRATLEAALADPGIKATLDQGKVALFRAFNNVWNALRNDETLDPTGGGPAEGAHAKLNAITPASRQALLLTTLEGFSVQQASEIMGASEDEINSLVTEAIEEIDREGKTNVLIIEDEPLISMQLEDLVSSLGHDICGTAATRTQAKEVVAKETPGLVLADIQLADGSSGLDAVDDILQIASVPIIFITAYPERLLTGDRPEPTYLITKPFQERTVRAAISQALFFGSTHSV